jgi:hypothetical protein
LLKKTKKIQRFRDNEKNYELAKNCPDFKIRQNTIPLLKVLNALFLLFRYLFILWIAENLMELFLFKKPLFVLLNSVQLKIGPFPFGFFLFSGLFSLIIIIYLYIMKKIKRNIILLEFQNMLLTKSFQEKHKFYLIFHKNGIIISSNLTYHQETSAFDLLVEHFKLTEEEKTKIQTMLSSKNKTSQIQLKNGQDLQLCALSTPTDYFLVI